MSDILKIPDVAAWLKVSESCVYSLVAENLIEHYRIGVGRGCIRFTRQHVLDYLERSTKEPEKLRHIV